MKLPATYYHTKKSKARVQIHQGGTRSGKTMSITQCLIEWCWLNKDANKIITICRKTFPALKATVMRDFFTILEKENWYSQAHHNKSEATYVLFGNLVEFISVDNSEKIRGRKRDFLFCNEATELSLEEMRQLMLRTTFKIIIDFNPSFEFHWIYDELIPREDADFFQTTYLDNPFLGEETIAEIERLKNTDENFWRVYGLGERGASVATIFNHWKSFDNIPADYKLMNYGLDFGYTNHPSCLVAVYTNGEGFILDELIYATGFTNSRIAEEMRIAGVGPHDVIIADCAEPKSIDEIHGFNFNIHSCRKGADSVRSGLDYMKSHPLGITAGSVNGIKEFRNYKYKEDRNGKILNTPVPAFDHFMDASRYAITFNQTNPNFGNYAIG